MKKIHCPLCSRDKVEILPNGRMKPHVDFAGKPCVWSGMPKHATDGVNASYQEMAEKAKKIGRKK